MPLSLCGVLDWWISIVKLNTNISNNMVTHISSEIIHFDAQNVIYFKIHSQMTINMNLIKYVQSMMPAVSQALWVLFWIWNILIYYTQLWIFSPLSTQTFDFWCLPEDLTRIIKLIYSHIRNWSLNWWIFKAIKLQHELINTMRDTMRLWLLPDDPGKGLRITPVTTGGTRCKQSKHNK